MNIIYMLMHDKFNYIRCSRTKPKNNIYMLMHDKSNYIRCRDKGHIPKMQAQSYNFVSICSLRERERERLRKWHFQMNIPVEFLDEFDLGVAARNFGRAENNSQL